MKGNVYSSGMTVLKHKYPQFSPRDTITFLKTGKALDFTYTTRKHSTYTFNIGIHWDYG